MTSQHLTTLLKGVRNWWNSDRYHVGVFTLLGVPLSKQREIRERYGSDDEKVVEKCFEWWLEHATYVGWRQIMHSLCGGREIIVANSLRQYAEPLSGIMVSTVILDSSFLTVRFMLSRY